MNQLLTVIPFCKYDVARAEELLAWHYQLHGRKQSGYCLLASCDDVHPEKIEVMKISASVAFESVDCIKIGRIKTNAKTQAINGMFKAVAGYVATHYRVPFFWCEPDFTPLKPNWIMQLAGEYYNQPRRYCGNIKRFNEISYPARCLIYPADAINDLGKFCDGLNPFNFNPSLLPMVTNSNLVSEIPIATLEDWSRVPQSAIGTHSDKLGIALAACEAALEKKASRHVASRTSR